MQLAVLKRVKKYYGDRNILDIKKFEIVDGDRIGLVGENGAGKTTLIKSLIGEVDIDEGEVLLTDSYSYISQKDEFIGECEDGKVKRIFNAPDEYEEFLSGGEKVKLRISKAIGENKSLIIADEPTSNLDEESIKLLENMLKQYSGSLLLVSHDREFLDNLCSSIVEIEDGKIKTYNGDYSNYIELKKDERKLKEREYNEFIKEKERLEKAILKKESLRDRIKQAPKGMGKSEAKTIKMGDQKGKKNIDENIKNIKSRIEHLQVKEKPKDIKDIVIKIRPGMELTSKIPIEAKDLNLVIGEKHLLNNANFKIKKGKKVAIIGKNGVGKTTLLKEILKNENESVKIAKCVKIGYFDQGQSILNEEKTILENIKAECSYDENFIRINLSHFGFKGDEVNKVVGCLSGGEHVKVALCKILLWDNNILILDEPTNYLDIKSMESLESALINTNKTVILVSHDRKFIKNVSDYIIELKNNTIKEFDGGYLDYINRESNQKINKEDKHNKEDLLVLENRLSEVISLLSLEVDTDKKVKLDNEYNRLIEEIRRIKEKTQ